MLPILSKRVNTKVTHTHDAILGRVRRRRTVAERLFAPDQSNWAWGRAPGSVRSVSGAEYDPGELPLWAAALVEPLENVADRQSSFSNYDVVRPAIRSRPLRRVRSGNPYTDGLVGVEPNPGPPSMPSRKTKRGGNNQTGGYSSRRTPSGGKLMLRGVAGNGAISMASAPAAVGSLRPNYGFVNRGTRKFLGVDAHVFTGTCAVATLTTDVGGVYRLTDAGANTGNALYLNPRICCQLGDFQTPAGYCPIGVIAQAYRKFCFTKLKITYTPVTASTAQNSAFSLAFDPEFVKSASLAANRMAYANFECSAFGPTWLPQELDVSRFLDRSKWYSCEVNGTSAVGDSTGIQGIQGTALLCPATDGTAGQSYGFFSITFELMMFELGPTEVFGQPSFLSVSTPPQAVNPSSSANPPVGRQDRPNAVPATVGTSHEIPGYVLVKQQ